MLSVVSRKFKVTVSGLDVTPLVEHFDVGDDRVGSSGLIPTRGTIKLRYNPKWNESRSPKISFDPKIPHSAQYWRRGEPVKIWIDDSQLVERKHPRHSLRVLKAKYDRYELSLTLEIGCLLALLDAPFPEGDESNTCVNETRPANAVIADVLRGAGKSYPNITIAYIGYVPGFIASPQEKGNGGSYIAFAGSIAYSRGYVLWITKDEEIKAIRIAPGNTTTRFVLDADRDVMEYNRGDEDVESNEAPYSRIRVRYNLVTLEENPKGYTSYMESFGSSPSGSPNKLIATTRVTDSIKGNTRTLETITQKPAAELFPWIYTEEQIQNGAADYVTIDEIIREIYEYEPTDVWEEENDKACSEENVADPKKQGRLTTKTKTILRQNWAVKQEWASQHETSFNNVFYDPKDKSKVWVITNQIVEAEKEITNYAYFGDPISSRFIGFTGIPDYSLAGSTTNSEESKEKGVKVIQTQYWIHEAYVYPKAWAYRNGKDGENPNGLIYAGRDLQTWNRRLGRSEWQRHTIETRLIGREQSGVVEARLKLALETDYTNTSFSSGSIFNAPETVESRRSYAVAQVRRFATYVTTVRNQMEVSSTQCNPPSPEYIPERFTRTEEEHVEDVYITSPYGVIDGRVKEISLESPIERKKLRGMSQVLGSTNTNNLIAQYGLRGIQDDIEQARITAEIESVTVWGRYRAIETTYDLRDIWFDLPHLPLTRFDIIDRDRITDEVYRHSYVVDGWTNAVTLRECLCSHDGLWLGTSLEIIPQTIYFETSVPITAGSTAIAVKPLPYALQEGDGVVLSTLTSLSFAGAFAGSSALLLTSPTEVYIPAGTQVLVEGQILTIKNNVPIGSSNILLEKPLNVPINTGYSGVAGTIATVSMYTPIGSTAIPVLPTSNTTTITPETGTINVQTHLSTTQIAQEFKSFVVLSSNLISYEKQKNTFESIVIVSYPKGNYQNIGVATFTSTIASFFGTSYTNNLRFASTSLVTFTAQQYQKFEVTSLNIFETSYSTNQTFTSNAILNSEILFLTLNVQLPSISLISFEPEIINQTVTFSSIVTATSYFTETSNNLNNGFHIIAVW